jgi:predicted dienelactone hydrolase
MILVTHIRSSVPSLVYPEDKVIIKLMILCRPCLAIVLSFPAWLTGASLPSEVRPPNPVYKSLVASYVWTDSSRATPANGSVAAHPKRSFAIDITYPQMPSNAQRGPLVVFVHGVDSNRRQSTFLTRFLAQAGYVVLAADFPLTARSTPGGATDAHAEEQARDVAFLVDHLADPANVHAPWAALLDASKYVVVGHSTGGAVALVAGFAPDYHDPRVAGVIALSPDACFFSHAFFSTRAVPLAIIGATNDRFSPLANNAAWAYQNSSAPHALATLRGGNHIYFTDYCLPDWLIAPMYGLDDTALNATMARYGPGTGCSAPPRQELPALSCSNQHALAETLVLAFVNEMLRGESRGVNALVGDHGPVSVAAER